MSIIKLSAYELLHDIIPFLHLNSFIFKTEAHTITIVIAAPITAPITALDIEHSVMKKTRR